MRHMHVKENHRQCGMTAAEEDVLAEFRGYLSRRISDAVEALYEEVPREAWPRVAARLEAVGLLPPSP
jgi:hypothetical protein